MVNRIFTIANLLLVAVGAYFGVTIFYAALTAQLDSGPPALPTPTPEQAAAAPPAALADFGRIVGRNLFNSGKKPLGSSKEETLALDVDKLKQTELKLKLWGTVFTPEGQTYAVIEDQKTHEQTLYRPGDAIQNASVKAVLRQKVVLTVEGRDEVLAMEEPGVPRAAVAGRPDPAGRPPMAAAPRLPGAEPPQQVTVPEEQIEKAMENLTELMNQATFRPHIEDGRPAGISITGIKPNAIFRKLRLRNGDVITGVNGQVVDSVEDAMRVFGSLSTEGPLSVNIKRRGREETLEYKIE
jgi:general secretion pathway protein C